MMEPICAKDKNGAEYWYFHGDTRRYSSKKEALDSLQQNIQESGFEGGPQL